MPKTDFHSLQWMMHKINPNRMQSTWKVWVDRGVGLTTIRRPALPTQFFFLRCDCRGRHRRSPLPLEWQRNWISPRWLKHVGLCEPASRVRVHHLSQSAGCAMYQGKWGRAALQMDWHLAGEVWAFFSSFWDLETAKEQKTNSITHNLGQTKTSSLQ